MSTVPAVILTAHPKQHCPVYALVSFNMLLSRRQGLWPGMSALHSAALVALVLAVQLSGCRQTISGSPHLAQRWVPQKGSFWLFWWCQGVHSLSGSADITPQFGFLLRQPTSIGIWCSNKTKRNQLVWSAPVRILPKATKPREKALASQRKFTFVLTLCREWKTKQKVSREKEQTFY